MWLCYLISFIPLVVGLVFWLVSKRVTIYEWLLAVAGGFLVTLTIHLLTVHGMTTDNETWSGHITRAQYDPEWVEKYKVAIYKTETYTTSDSKGRTKISTRRVFSHYETRYRTHPDEWTAYSTLDTWGGTSISHGFYNEIKHNFGSEVPQDGNKSGFYSGDPHIYVVSNKSSYIYPVTAWRSFENRVKAAPSLFSYAKIPASVKVFDYPANRNWLSSDRLLGTARSCFTIRTWDCLNSRLGPIKKVNLIACGFPPDSDPMLAQYQEAAWIGGRKNDLVLCFGGDPVHPTWTRVFGWTEQEIVKRNLESLLLAGPIGDSLLPKIEQEVIANYKIKDWSKFDYITVEPPTWSYVVLILVMMLTQTGYWFWAYNNDFSKFGQCEFFVSTRGNINNWLSRLKLRYKKGIK